MYVMYVPLLGDRSVDVSVGLHRVRKPAGTGLWHAGATDSRYRCEMTFSHEAFCTNFSHAAITPFVARFRQNIPRFTAQKHMS